MISSAEVSEFRERGVVVVRGLLPREIVEHCRQALESYKDFTLAKQSGAAVFDQTEDGKEYLKYFQNLNLYIPEFWQLFDTRVAEVAKKLLDQDVYFYGIGLHDKAPKIGTFTPFHQDNYYWCLDPYDAMTAYMPLEPQSPENGGIIYVPGSHLGKTFNHVKSKVKAFSSSIEGFDPSGAEFFHPTLEPGDVAFHHGNLIHGAEENTSSRHRRAISNVIYGTRSRISPSMRATYLKNLEYNRNSD